MPFPIGTLLLACALTTTTSLAASPSSSQQQQQHAIFENSTTPRRQRHRNIRRELTNIHKFWAAGQFWDDYSTWSQSDKFKTTGARDGTYNPSSSEVSTNDAIYQESLDARGCDASHPLCDATGAVTPISIPTRFHVIRREDSHGGLTDDEILDSIDVLNEAFAPYFVFAMDFERDVTFSDDSEWYNAKKSESGLVTAAFEKGGTCSDLHVYSLQPDGGVLGWASFPDACNGDAAQDGVFILNGSVPGGYAFPYNRGHNLVHQVGHWLGLYNTFQGLCDGDGTTTRPTDRGEVLPAYTCGERNACALGDVVGAGPAESYMDYTDDSCTKSFTDEQFARMLAMWEYYRAPVKPKPPIKATNAEFVSSNQSQKTCQELEIEMETDDDTGDVVHWTLLNNKDNSVLEKGGPYHDDHYLAHYICLEPGKYTFVIEDSGKNGLNSGYYKLRLNGKLIHEGADFTEKDEYKLEIKPSKSTGTSGSDTFE
eukprot:CAMPEP_0172485654 /NCGR_PEP_ID=MMETSP1066-20121228/13776_1 /TAXON_ID=671091 /ORGANISM="Coscinodiscus wailesii, Strain CCMP2513" /LENGTH=482 /DNA_ID=CAMNT_0013251043 /DNA_START=150 /DNA_END=1598 /DNA_ORIENTATION=+